LNRSRFFIRLLLAVVGLIHLSGCLQSDVPLFDKRSARAKPIDAGDYIACPVILTDDAGAGGDTREADECVAISVSVDKKRGTIFYDPEEDEETRMRFRRVAYGAYAVEVQPSGDKFEYYFGRKDGRTFYLTKIMCSSLPQELRDDLIAREEMTTEDADFSTCTATTRSAVLKAAKAYHRDALWEREDELPIILTPAALVSQ